MHRTAPTPGGVLPPGLGINRIGQNLYIRWENPRKFEKTTPHMIVRGNQPDAMITLASQPCRRLYRVANRVGGVMAKDNAAPHPVGRTAGKPEDIAGVDPRMHTRHEELAAVVCHKKLKPGIDAQATPGQHHDRIDGFGRVEWRIVKMGDEPHQAGVPAKDRQEYQKQETPHGEACQDIRPRILRTVTRAVTRATTPAATGIKSRAHQPMIVIPKP